MTEASIYISMSILYCSLCIGYYICDIIYASFCLVVTDLLSKLENTAFQSRGDDQKYRMHISCCSKKNQTIYSRSCCNSCSPSDRKKHGQPSRYPNNTSTSRCDQSSISIAAAGPGGNIIIRNKRRGNISDANIRHTGVVITVRIIGTCS